MNTKDLTEIKNLCKEKDLNINQNDIKTVIDSYHKVIYDRLSTDGFFRIENIGKIHSIIVTGVSNITKKEYETVKFKFTSSAKLIREVKETFIKAKAKYL